MELGTRSIRRTQRQLLRAEGGEFDNPPRKTDLRHWRDPSPRVVMLLEDCQSGDRVEAAILIEVESTETQLVEICGNPLSGTFKLEFDGQTTDALDYDITAEDLQEAMEALANINSGDVVVELGPGAELGDNVIYRWLIHFTGQYDNASVPAIMPTAVSISGQGLSSIVDLAVEVRDQPDLEDTGDTLEVLCVVPLPPGVTIWAGNIGIALPVPSFGYCLVAAECRDCEAPY